LVCYFKERTYIENRAFKRIFGPKEEGETERWKMCNKMNKLRIRWVGYEARMEETKTTCRNYVRNPECNMPLERTKFRWNDGIRTHLNETG
jgi:hypothetical protein